jgi:hypothetical protein
VEDYLHFGGRRDSEIEFEGAIQTGLFFGSFQLNKYRMETEILQQRAADVLNVESSIVALSHEHASELFSKATHRLLNIRKWHTLPCSLLTELKLTDHNGFQVDRQVHENDYFIVNNSNGDGEWIKVERVFFQCDPSGRREVLTLRARPSCNPQVGGEEQMRQSNTFKVTRQGVNITVSVYGKNEEDGHSKAHSEFERDAERPDVTVGAIPGVARVHWRSLVNGILSTWI